MSFTIHKSFTKNDLIDICSDISLPIVYSKEDTKHDIQTKIYSFFKEWKQYSFPTNHYKIKVLFPFFKETIYLCLNIVFCIFLRVYNGE